MSVRVRSLVLSIAAVLVAAPLAASAEAPLRGTYIEISPDQAEIWTPGGAPMGDILYLNRCVGDCLVNGSSSSNSSLTDSSTITGDGFSSFPDRTLSEFAHGDETWDQVVSCVRGVFEPYGITVTDEDPGTASHHEVMVAGTDVEFGMDGALGVSPFTCSPINNSLTFVFANLTGSVNQLCWAAAQEPAHSWGLDHEMLCEDPMTYLTACGDAKYAFQDVAAPCGEDQNRPCNCGGASTQNSHQRIAFLFGTGFEQPPEISIVRPADGSVVRPGFAIEASIADDSRIEAVELYIDGELMTSLPAPPYVFNAPLEIIEGNVDIEIRAADVHGAAGSAATAVTVSENPEMEGGEGGGCQLASGGGGAGALALLFALAVARRSRRR